jgi:hypothetical protein
MPVESRPIAGRLRSVAAPAGVAAAATAFTVYVSLIDPNQPGHYPTCPLLFITGLYCPGCGSLRAVHALGHADIVGALDMNPLGVLILPVLLFWWGRWAVRAWQGRRARAALAHPAYIWAFLALVIVYWIVRNLPFGRFLAP